MMSILCVVKNILDSPVQLYFHPIHTTVYVLCMYELCVPVCILVCFVFGHFYIHKYLNIISLLLNINKGIVFFKELCVSWKLSKTLFFLEGLSYKIYELNLY